MPTTKKTKSAVTFSSNSDVAIHVPDLQKAEAFYGGALGFTVTSRGDDHLAFDTGRFTLWVNKDPHARSFVPSFDVSNHAAAKQVLEASGCKVLTAGKVTYYQDPFGFLFDIIQAR